MTCSRVLELARALTAVAGVAGREDTAAQAARELLQPLGELSVTPTGSVLCTVCAGEAGAPHIMLEAHLDQIGLIVTRVEEDGFLRIGSVGGFDRRTLPAAPVLVHAREGSHPGVICSVPPHLAGKDSKPLKIEEFAVDTGFGAADAKARFHAGDIVTLEHSFVELANGRIAAGAMDDRIGCVAVIAAAEEIKRTGSRCRVTVALCSQEEAGGAGARTAAYSLKPDRAIAVDVSFGEGFGAPAAKCGKLGEGAMLGMAPVLDNGMTAQLERIADEKGILWQPEVMGGRTGTDADGIATAGAGVRTALLSIPLRNMHTVVETAAVEDVIAVARLMAEYVKEAQA